MSRLGKLLRRLDAVMGRFVRTRVPGYVRYLLVAVLSALFALAVDRTVSASLTLLMFAVVLTALGAVAVTDANRRQVEDDSRRVLDKVEELRDGAERAVDYVEEQYRPAHQAAYKGKVFAEVERIVRGAQEEILVLATSTSAGMLHATHATPARLRYFAAIQDAVARCVPDPKGEPDDHGKPFRYVRIQQVGREPVPDGPEAFFGPGLVEHLNQMVELREQSRRNGGKLDIYLGAVPTERLTSFIIVDRRHLFLEVTGFDEQATPFPAGMFHIEDRAGERGKVIGPFIQYFERNVERGSKQLVRDATGRLMVA